MKDVNSKDVHRAAAALLPRLAAGAARLERVTGREGVYGYRLIFAGRSRRDENDLLDASVVKTLVSNRLVTIDENLVSLTDEAHMWLRRLRAGADPFLEQHQIRSSDKREIGGSIRPVVVNDGESPLGWLRHRKDRDGAPLLSNAQFEAGERLRRDFERAQLMPSVTSSWSGLAPTRRTRRSAPDDAAEINDSVLEARRRVERALAAVGPELAGVLIDVCCHLAGLAETEKSNGWPQRSGKVILQMALTRLARHYGLHEHGIEKSGRGGSRFAHWGSEGFRPTLDGWRD